MTKKQLENVKKGIVHHPHVNINIGSLVFDPKVFDDFDRETNVCISPGCSIDCTGNVAIGPWCMIGAGTKIYTHDHFHEGRIPLLLYQEKYGVWWKDKVIGRDVWLHGCIILAQVEYIPDGVVVGAGAVLTKQPGPYEIWAGNPARKIGER
jgi:acetyltransferase-like isoleucine patch superfamily enzyme